MNTKQTSLSRLLLFSVTLSTLAVAGVASSRFPGTSARFPDEVPQMREELRERKEQKVQKEQAGHVFQVSTLPALSLGLYDGVLPMRDVLRRGDFGLGTVHALDGEVIILDGKAWQIRSNGQVILVDSGTTTPFAVVTRFTTNQKLGITQALEYSRLRSILDQKLITANIPYAIQISGTFSRMKTRSVPRQSKPYRPLAEVTKNQSVFEMQNVKGTLVGFRFPSYLANVNLAGYHFHFISDDRMRGGHLLNCELASGEIRFQPLRNFEMMLPQANDFDNANLAADQSDDLKQAETGH